MSLPFCAVALAAIYACATPTGSAEQLASFDASEGTAGTVALVGAHVITMESNNVLESHTVTISNGRIVSVAPDGTASLQPGTQIVDVRGLYLMPGLADMHVHLRPDDGTEYLRAGVTTIRNLWGYQSLAGTVSDYATGRRDGPTVYTLSPGLDGTPAKWPETVLVLDPNEVDDVVDRQIADGYTTLKLYQDLRTNVFEEIVRVARSQGIQFGGHVPHRVGLERVLEVGYSAIEHLSGYELHLGGTRGFGGWATVDVAGIEPIGRRTAAAGVWNCPTLSIALATFSTPPGSDAPFAVNRRRMVKALHDAGAGLLVGTDAGIGRTQPGVSLHDELQEFVEAGLTPFEALLGATANAAVFLERTGEFGRVAPGLRGDLVLLDSNPFENIEAVRRPVGVVVRGRSLTP